jgi:hypothetical protein
LRRRFARAGFHEPSLVPMADMLTNTVGVMVFILIFTVLTAGGAIIPKRMPMERGTSKERKVFVCAGGRILALDTRKLIKSFVEPLGEPEVMTTRDWVQKYESRKIDSADYTVTGKAATVDTALDASRVVLLQAAVKLQPLPGRGDPPQTLASETSTFHRTLAQTSPDESFVFFLVFPDSIAAHRTAREAVVAAGYQTGWSPMSPAEGVNITFFSAVPTSGGIPTDVQ